MEVIERQMIHQSWITIVFILCFVLLALLKLYSPNYLLKYFKAFFLQGFIQKRIEETPSLLTAFDFILYVFTVIVFSLSITIIVFRDRLSLAIYIAVFFFLFFYGLLRRIIDKFLEIIIIQNKSTIYFRFIKIVYLETIALWLLPILIVHQYGFKSIDIIIWFLAILFIVRAFLIIVNNKYFILKNLFYFILYLCTLEIAPLLILYKLAKI